MTWTALTSTRHDLPTRPSGTPLGSPLTTIEVAMLGDSITYGESAVDAGGWRTVLGQLATRAGMSLTSVGINTDSNAPLNNHNGVSGSTIPDHNTGGSVNSIATLATHQPDVAFVFLGFNDANNSTLTANASANYLSLMRNAHSASPNTRFVVGRLFQVGDATRRANIATVRAAMEAAWDTLDSEGLLIVRAETRVISFPTDLYEGNSNPVHPTATGYAKLAHAFWPAFRNACGFHAVW